MNRRELIAFSGAALAAQQAVVLAQDRPTAAVAGQHLKAAKTLVKYSRNKSSYKVPKSDAKAARYAASLSAALALSDSQQQAATDIFTIAARTRVAQKSAKKDARKAINAAVLANDSNAINQAAGAIAAARAQLVAAGARAHSAFNQLLTPDQRARMLQFRS